MRKLLFLGLTLFVFVGVYSYFPLGTTDTISAGALDKLTERSDKTGKATVTNDQLIGNSDRSEALSVSDSQTVIYEDEPSLSSDGYEASELADVSEEIDQSEVAPLAEIVSGKDSFEEYQDEPSATEDEDQKSFALESQDG